MASIRFSNKKILALLFVLIIVGIAVGIYFGVRGSDSGGSSTQDMGSNFRITFWNTNGTNVQDSFSSYIREAVNFWEERLVETDRINIDVKSVNLNTTTTLAYASMRDSSNIKSGGELTINLNASAQNWIDVVKHEIGHILGIGAANVWRNAVIGSGGVYHLDKNLFPETYQIYQDNYDNPEDNIPLGDVTHHFDEAVFGTELMTPFSNEGQRQPITDLTLTALATIGWNIDLTKGEPKN